MPKPTFLNLPEEKRQRIIDAAVEEFSSVPYARATLDNIVEAAGVSKGSMYQYFGGKADLYGWLLTDHLPRRKVEALGIEAAPDAADVWTVLEQAFVAGLRFAAGEPRLSRLGARFLRDHELEPELAAISQQNKAAAEAWLLRLLERAQVRGELKPGLDLPIAVGFLAHALGEGMLDHLARRLGLSLEELLDHPEAAAQLSDDEALALVRSATDLFRYGAAA